VTIRASKSDKRPRRTGASSTLRTQVKSLLTDGGRTTLELAIDVLEYPDAWLRTSNPQLGDRRPIDLMGTPDEAKVFDLLHAADQGLF